MWYGYPSTSSAIPAPRSVSCGARDRDQIAQHALARELGAGSGSDDRDLSDRRCAEDDCIGGPLDMGQRIVAANQLGLDASGHVPRSIRFGELERRDVLEPRAGGFGLVDLRARGIGDCAAGDLLASELGAEG